MTSIKDTLGRELQQFDKFFVGFDDQVKRMQKVHDDFAKNIPNYPPYNIKKVDDNKYIIELAVAGFNKSEIEIEFIDDKLVVKGSIKENNSASNYLFKGIADRSFTRTFALNDHIEIKGAGLVNGMLQIVLERIIPENKKAKKIEISDEPSTVSSFTHNNVTQHSVQPQLLIEDEI